MTSHPLFHGRFGYADRLRVHDPAAALARDRALDAALEANGWPAWRAAQRRAAAPRRVFAIIPTVPAAAAMVRAQAAALRGEGAVHVHVDMREGGRGAKINDAWRTQPAAREADWLLILDDDVALCAGFVDAFLDTAEAAGLVLAQPAHRIHSHIAYAVTARQPASIARRTAFVEIGPVMAMHRSVAGHLLPLATNGAGWGIDFLWADRARREGWRIGVVDATPFEHLRPMGTTYSRKATLAEASALLFARAPEITRERMLAPGRIVIGW